MSQGWETCHKFPALVLSILIAAGIWGGSQIPRTAIIPLFTLSAAATMLAAGSLALRDTGSTAILRSCCCIVLPVALGALKIQADTPPGILLPQSVSRDTLTVIGYVASEPEAAGRKVRFAFQSRSFVRGDSLLQCTEEGLVTCVGARSDSSLDAIRYGAVLSVRGMVERIPEAGNPGEFSPRQYYGANGVTFMMRVRGRVQVHAADTTAGFLLMDRIVLPARRAIVEGIDRDIGGEEGEFLKGLLIGERSGLSPSVRRAFLDSGVAHILAVSGSNVAVVAATIMMLLSFLRVPRTIGRVLAIAGLVLYMLLSGAQPPVVRATIMALALLACAWLARRVHPLNGVGLAGVIMFAIDPRQLFDIGFQLSFGAVLSILLLYPALMARVRGHARPVGVRRLLRPVVGVAAVSLAASLGTLPLTAMAFGRISLVGFLANLLIVPASGASVVLGIISAAISPASEWVAGAYATVNRILLMLTIDTAGIAASLPYATLDLLWFRPVHFLPYYAGLACLFSIGRPGRLRRGVIVFLAASNISLYAPDRAALPPASSLCRIHMIDVGQGEALLIESPAGERYLIDTGPPSRDGSAWGTSVVPFLKRLGVRTLDAVIITHLHDDHAGGLRQVLQSFAVRSILSTPDAVPLVTRLAGRDSGGVKAMYIGCSFGGPECRFHVLAPESLATKPGISPNRRSIVLHMAYGRVGILLTGDAEAEEENALIARYGGFLRSEVLKVGHHGSRAGTSALFLEAVDPEYALISVGRYNRFGHPSRATLERLETAGIETYRTDENGAVVLATDGTHVEQIRWR